MTETKFAADYAASPKLFMVNHFVYGWYTMVHVWTASQSLLPRVIRVWV
jgi:hypothetical protein